MQTGATRTHYETLGVGQEATADQIRTAYRAQIRLVHPDVAGPDGAPRAAALSAAYAVLSKPDQRSAYDESLLAGLRPPEPEPTEFEAGWGRTMEWKNDQGEQPLDDVVVETAESGTGDRAGDSKASFGWVKPRPSEPPDLRLRYPARGLIIHTAIGLLVILVAGLFVWLTWTSEALLTRPQTAGIALGAAVLGLLAGFGLQNRSLSLSNRSLSLSKGRAATGPPLAVLGAVILIIVGELSIEPPRLSLSRLGYVAALAIALGMLLQDRVARQRGLNAVLPIKVLRHNNIFGSPSGEVATALLERDCDPLYSLAGLRIVRTPASDALFSHVFVCGTRVAFARALVADGGLFRWSGPTLFRDGAGGWPTEVLRGAYEEACRRMPAALGRGTDVGCWILVYPPDGAVVQQAPDPLLPSVVTATQGIDAIGRHLTSDNDVTLVDHRRMVAAANLLYG